jgi:hypothetical protein
VSARSRLARCALLGLVAAMSTSGCGSKAPSVTGLTVTITMVGVAADQLELAVTTPAGEALAPTRRPVAAGAVLSSPQSVSIFLPDALAGDVATCTVTPYIAGQVTGAVVAGTATLVLHQLVPLAIELDATPHDDGGAPDAAGTDASDGGGDDAGAPEVSNDVGRSDGPGTKANGQACATGGECDSTLCVDGVCCASACGTLCQACNVPGKEGTCAPVPSGTTSAQCAKQPATTCSFDGTCNGSGGCRRYPAGVACKAASCLGPTYTPASACDGQGVCVAAKAVNCTPYNCDSSTGAAACIATCKTGGTDCVAPAVCANGSCGPKVKQANGAGCLAIADCISGFCADGVCCAVACTGGCVSCNQPGSEGMCLPVAVGKADPHNVCKDAGATTCGKNGLCDGAGACALYPVTTMCAAGSCNRATVRPAHHCDGKGVCATPTNVDCTPYKCDPTTTACFTACTGGAQCAAGHACAAPVCQ